MICVWCVWYAAQDNLQTSDRYCRFLGSLALHWMLNRLIVPCWFSSGRHMSGFSRCKAWSLQALIWVPAVQDKSLINSRFSFCNNIYKHTLIGTILFKEVCCLYFLSVVDIAPFSNIWYFRFSIIFHCCLVVSFRS